MKRDPFTLRVALGKDGTAKGELYLDDGESYRHREGEVVWREFSAEKKGKTIRLTSKDLVSRNLAVTVDGVALSKYNPKNAFAKSVESVRVERVLVLGLKAAPKSAKVQGGQDVDWDFKDGVLVLKNPSIKVVEEWEVVIHI